MQKHIILCNVIHIILNECKKVNTAEQYEIYKHYITPPQLVLIDQIHPSPISPALKLPTVITPTAQLIVLMVSVLNSGPTGPARFDSWLGSVIKFLKVCIVYEVFHFSCYMLFLYLSYCYE